MPNLSQLRRLKPYLTAPFNPNVDEESQVGTVAPQVLKRLQDIVSTQPNVGQPETAAPLSRPLPMVDAQPDVAPNPEFTRPRRVLPNFADTSVDLAAPSVEVNQPTLAKFPGLMQRPSDVGPRPDTSSQINYLQNQPIEKGQGGFGHDLVRALKMAALRGKDALIQTGNPINAAGAAVFGAGEGGFDRSSRQRYGREHELQRLRGVQAREFETEGARTKLDLMRSQVQENQSQAYARQHPALKEPKTFQGANGLQYRLSPDGTSATLIEGQDAKPSTPKVLRTKTLNKKVYYETPDGLIPAIDPTTEKQFEDDSGPSYVDVPGYGRMPAGTKYTGDATAGRYNTTVQNEFGRESDRYNTEQVKQQYAQTLKDWEDAGRTVSDINTLIAAHKRAESTIKGIDNVGEPTAAQQAAVAKAWADKAQLEDEINAKGEYLTNTYGQHVVRNRDGSYSVNSRPTMPALPKPTAPKMLTRPKPRTVKNDPAGLYTP